MLSLGSNIYYFVLGSHVRLLCGRLPSRDSVKFCADHPFLYLIVRNLPENSGRITIFIGKVCNLNVVTLKDVRFIF